jgi:hypothetical protein
MPKLAKPIVSEADVRAAFCIQGFLSEVPAAGLGWLGQKFRVDPAKAGNKNGVIAIELWWGRGGHYGWAIYLSADGMENHNTRGHLARNNIKERYFDGGARATCFELVKIDAGAKATHEQVMAAAGVACKLAGTLL